MLADELRNITDWLIDGARSASSPTRADGGKPANGWSEAGLPLWRCGIFVRTLHPDILGRNFIWRPRRRGHRRHCRSRLSRNRREFKSSPLGRSCSARGGKSDTGSMIPRPHAFPFFDDMARPKPSPTILRCRWCSRTVLFTPRVGRQSIRADSATTNSPGLRMMMAPLGAAS